MEGPCCDTAWSCPFIQRSCGGMGGVTIIQNLIHTEALYEQPDCFTLGTSEGLVWACSGVGRGIYIPLSDLSISRGIHELPIGKGIEALLISWFSSLRTLSLFYLCSLVPSSLAMRNVPLCPCCVGWPEFLCAYSLIFLLFP